MSNKKAKKDNPETDNQAVLSELKLIRQLLLILLAKLDSDSGEIGEALGLEPRRIREWISFNGIQKFHGEIGKKESKSKSKSKSKRTPSLSKEKVKPIINDDAANQENEE